MSRVDEYALIVSLMPAPGFYALMVNPNTDDPEFRPLLGWTLIEWRKREPTGNDEFDIRRQIEGMIAIHGSVESCEEYTRYHTGYEYGWLFLYYVHQDQPQRDDLYYWQEEAKMARDIWRRREPFERFSSAEPSTGPCPGTEINL